MTPDISGSQTTDSFIRVSIGLFITSIIGVVGANVLNPTIGFCLSAILNVSGLIFGFLAYKRIGKSNFQKNRNITRLIIYLHMAFVALAIIYFGFIAYYWRAIMTMH